MSRRPVPFGGAPAALRTGAGFDRQAGIVTATTLARELRTLADYLYPPIQTPPGTKAVTRYVKGKTRHRENRVE